MKSVTTLVVALSLGASSATLADGSNDIAPAGGSTSNPTSTVSAGKAKLCALDDVRFDTYRELTLPASSVFKDLGAIPASKANPEHWVIPHDGQRPEAGFVTLDAVTLGRAKRCAETRVKMLITTPANERSQTAEANHLFVLDDVLDYPIPAARPPIEIGKLIDDMSVFAVLTADVNETVESKRASMDDAKRAAKCLTGSQNLAAYVGAGTGTPTMSVVPLSGVPSKEASYGRPFGPKDAPDLYVAWDKARPSASTISFIAKAGEYLTGATAAEIRTELAGCVAEALKPDAGEMANREFRGARIECQAFTRDGGGGSATVYRRFGAAPVHLDATAEQRATMLSNSEKARTDEQARTDSALAFAQWWADPSIPPKVKTFAMLSARILALSERCSSWKPNLSRPAFLDAFQFESVPASTSLLRAIEVLREANRASAATLPACQSASKELCPELGDGVNQAA